MTAVLEKSQEISRGLVLCITDTRSHRLSNLKVFFGLNCSALVLGSEQLKLESSFCCCCCRGRIPVRSRYGLVLKEIEKCTGPQLSSAGYACASTVKLEMPRGRLRSWLPCLLSQLWHAFLSSRSSLVCCCKVCLDGASRRSSPHHAPSTPSDGCSTGKAKVISHFIVHSSTADFHPTQKPI